MLLGEPCFPLRENGERTPGVCLLQSKIHSQNGMLRQVKVRAKNLRHCMFFFLVNDPGVTNLCFDSNSRIASLDN